MKIWPKNYSLLKRQTALLSVLFLVSVAIIFILVYKVYKLSVSPPFNNQSSLSKYLPELPCRQRTDATGWQLIDGRIRNFPSCLTVQNGRLGSRLSFNYYASGQKITSGVLGSLEDKNINLTLSVSDNNTTERIFPAQTNTIYTTQSADLGLTYQKLNFDSAESTVSLNIISPFAPSTKIEDNNAKLSAAPFFYLELELANKTGQNIARTISIALANPGQIQSQNHIDQIIFSDTARRDGLLALAANQNPDLKPFTNSGFGGFDWKVQALPHSTVKTILVWAGFTPSSVLTNTTNNNNAMHTFAYTRWFKDIGEVISYALQNQNEITAKTNTFESGFQAKKLNPQTFWIMAQAFHSYIANTWLVSPAGQTEKLNYYVWEGEFKYLNTVDVAHDYAPLPGLYFPWVLRLELESWAKSVKQDAWGKVIPHDLGARFTDKGKQEYAIPGAETSGMPVEENCNFILLAYWYWYQTKDTNYIKQKMPLVKDLIASLVKRDTNNNGIADTGLGITTFDNDGNTALYNSPDSTYLGIKQLAAYLSAAKLADLTKDSETKISANNQAGLISASVAKIYREKGFIPLTLDSQFTEKYQFEGKTIHGNEEQGMAFISGLLYPALTGMKDDNLQKLIPSLSDSFKLAREKSLVKNDNGTPIGLKLAQYQSLRLGWFSNSIIGDFVAAKLFNQSYDSAGLWFPYLYDNPHGFSDGQYFTGPTIDPKTTLIFYPRGAAAFAFMK